MQEMPGTRVQSLIWEDPLEEGMAIHSRILAWRIPWTEEPGGLQSIGSQSQTLLKQLNTHTHTHTHKVVFWTTSIGPSTTNISYQLITRPPPATKHMTKQPQVLSVPLETQTCFYILPESTTYAPNAPINIHRPISNYMRKNP